MQTEKPIHYFTPNPISPADPLFHLELYHPDEGTYYGYEMSFHEAFLFASRLSRDVTAILMQHPKMAGRVAIREVDAAPSTDSYKPKRGILARLLARE